MKQMRYFGTLLLFNFHVAFSQNDSIHFLNKPIDSLYYQAKIENKLIFIYLYTEWCGPCKWMDKNTFTNNQVTKYYNNHFINIKIDAEKDTNFNWINYYDISCFPTFLYLDDAGTLCHRTCGMRGPEDFIQLGEIAQDTALQYRTYYNLYNSGTLSESDIFNYILLRNSSHLPIRDQLNYYDKVGNITYQNRNTWYLLYHLVENKDSRIFEYFIQHRAQFTKIYGQDSVNHVIGRVYTAEMELCLSKTPIDTGRYNSLKMQLWELNLPNAETILLTLEMRFYERQENWDKYGNASKLYLQGNQDSNQVFFILDILRNQIQYVMDSTVLDVGVKWAHIVATKAPSSYTYMIYANILLKRKKIHDSLIALNRALMFSLKDGLIEGYEIKELLSKIHRRKKLK